MSENVGGIERINEVDFIISAIMKNEQGTKYEGRGTSVKPSHLISYLVNRTSYFVFLFSTCLFTTGCSQPSTVSPQGQPYSSVRTFVASTPCDGVRLFVDMPATKECDFIRWNLVLYQDPDDLTPTLFKLIATYGVGKPNTNGFMGGGTRTEIVGKWSIVNTTRSGEDAVVYRLEPEGRDVSISILKIDDNIFHLLDAHHDLMIGNGGWSYTLNRYRNTN